VNPGWPASPVAEGRAVSSADEELEVMLGEVISRILLTTCPEKVELSLGKSNLDHVVPHVISIVELHTFLGCEKVMGSGVVCFNGGPQSRLWVSN